MKTITFVTSNIGKVKSLARNLPADKFTIIHEPLSLPELQGDTARQVSGEKAKEAFKILKRPLIIQDSAFHINALKGFPGPYIKYIQTTIGLEGLLKLLEGVEDRSCCFEQAVTYIDKDTIQTFVSDKKMGTVAQKIDTTESSRAWGIIWKLFIPLGFTKTLSAMTDEELSQIDSKTKIKSEFTYFAEWLLKNGEEENQ